MKMRFFVKNSLEKVELNRKFSTNYQYMAFLLRGY